MRYLFVAVLSFFFGFESGYTIDGRGMPETPQTWAIIAFVLAIVLVFIVSWKVKDGTST